MSKQFLPCAALSLACGICVGSYPRIWLVLLLALLILGTAYWLYTKQSTYLPAAVVVAVALVIGLALASHTNHAHSRLYEIAGQQGREVQATVLITGDLEFVDDKLSCEGRVSSLLANGKRTDINEKVRLTLSPDWNESDPVQHIHPGDLLLVDGLLVRPKEPTNPGQFNYKAYLRRRGIQSLLYSRWKEVKLLHRGRGNPLVVVVGRIRRKIIDVIERTFADPACGILEALMLGYRANIPWQVEEDFIKSGCIHILAVSGLHVGFVLAFCFGAARILRFSKRLTSAAAILVVILYVFLTGMRPSVVRAGIMAISVLAAPLFGKKADIVTSLSLAAISMLLVNPQVVFDAGFQLSFAATLGIVLLSPVLLERFEFYLPKLLAGALAVSISALLFTAPFTIYHFHRLSFISLFTSLLMTPLLGLVLTAGWAAVLLSLVHPLFGFIPARLAGLLVSYMLSVTGFFGSFRYASLNVASFPPPLLVVYILVMVWFFGFGRNKATGLILTHLILITCIVLPLPDGKLTITFLDVGQGDAAFIQTPSGRTVLIDAGEGGPVDDEGFNAGKQVVAPFLRSLGINSLDVVIITHPHMDHCGGFPAAIRSIPVDLVLRSGYDGNLYGYDLVTGEIERAGVQSVNARRGQRLDFHDGTTLDILYPAQVPMEGLTGGNNHSIVCLLRYGDFRCLFTGDLEVAGEEYLLESGTDVRAAVLKVAHHGDAKATSTKLLRAVGPRAAVISVGRNKFGHPAPETLQRLESADAVVYRTDMCGAVLLKTDGSLLWIDTFR